MSCSRRSRYPFVPARLTQGLGDGMAPSARYYLFAPLRLCANSASPRLRASACPIMRAHTDEPRPPPVRFRYHPGSHAGMRPAPEGHGCTQGRARLAARAAGVRIRRHDAGSAGPARCARTAAAGPHAQARQGRFGARPDRPVACAGAHRVRRHRPRARHGGTIRRGNG